MRAKQIDKQNGECLEENTPKSNSPFGVVTDTESLGRFIYVDDQIDVDGNLAPGAMQSKDLIARNGVSVSRLFHMGSKDICKQISSIETRRKAQIHGIAVANVSDIRKLRNQQGRRLFCVIDDAIASIPAHALICLESRVNITKSLVEKHRNTLLKQFKFHPREDYIFE